ncbi:MAG: ABC transporter ATP-binding protein [Clostridia bacterium]|nr:ABC transporter ATP-binding protein [Clostridia bacterium]
MNGIQMSPRPKKQDDGVEKPKSLRDLPRYVGQLVSGFFKRLFYIVSLVLEAAPALFWAMILLCIADGFMPVFGAYVSKDLLNEVALLIGKTASGSIAEDIFVTMRPLLLLFVAYFVYLLLRKLLSRLNTMVTNITGELVVNHIKLKIIGKAREVDLASFDRPEFYEKLENANREAGMRPIQILTATFSVVSASISVLSFAVVLAGLSPFAPLAILVAAIPGATVNYFYRKKSFTYLRRHSKERRQMNYYSQVMTSKDMAKEVKLLGLSDSFIAKYKQVFNKYYDGLKKLILKEGVMQAAVGIVSSVVSCILFLYVAYRVIYLDGQIGDYSLYTGALTSITGYVTTLMTATAVIYEGTLFINNMIDFMKEEPTVVSSISEPVIPKKGGEHTIEFKNVSFRYPGTDRDVLKNINLTLRQGDSVVLVGLNGAGKTTLIKLLTRLYDPTEGVILLDGQDIRKYDIKALYDLFGIIFQDFGRYAESAADNIAFGDVGREQDIGEIIIAADRASADEFISRLPRGYDTPLTRLFEEQGIELSGGQWQKLSVARAFYKESDILILDEPTASLDAIAEREVFDRFTELSRDKLTVFVSHRLSSAVGASKIVVLSDGEITEVGTHGELMALGGEYHRLFTTQAGRYTS